MRGEVVEAADVVLKAIAVEAVHPQTFEQDLPLAEEREPAFAMVPARDPQLRRARPCDDLVVVGGDGQEEGRGADDSARI